jgi:AraC-like DNA-binding protein
LAKIALDLDAAIARRFHDGTRGKTTPHVLARGPGWNVADVLCTCGPHDASFEEQHGAVLVALVVAGVFDYRTRHGAALMTPGAVMLGNAGDCFECGHTHRTGDRCIAFRFSPEWFERIAADPAVGARKGVFDAARIAPSRAFSRFVAIAAAGVSSRLALPWDELAIAVAAQALGYRQANSVRPRADISRAMQARIAQAVERIEAAPADAPGVERLAQEAGVSPYHFLRTFERVTGATPHQYVMRARLRGAAVRLTDAPGRIIDLAYDSGFDDISNFNRAFRNEFGVSPRHYRTAFAASMPALWSRRAIHGKPG